VLASVVALLFGASGDLSIWIGLAGAALVVLATIRLTFGRVAGTQKGLSAMFPARDERR
jgi:hypothetical protein